VAKRLALAIIAVAVCIAAALAATGCGKDPIVGSWRITDPDAAQIVFSVTGRGDEDLYTVTWSNGAGSASGPMTFYIKKESDGVYVTSHSTGSPMRFTIVGDKNVGVRYTTTAQKVVNFNFSKQQ